MPISILAIPRPSGVTRNENQAQQRLIVENMGKPNTSRLKSNFVTTLCSNRPGMLADGESFSTARGAQKELHAKTK